MVHILVVDDDPDMHRRVRSWLTPHGFHVDHAEDSAEANHMLELASKGREFNLIVCDNNMRIPGEGLAFGIKLYLTGVNIPFILHTSAQPHELNQEKLGKHSIAYVHKSTKPDELLQKVNELLQAKNATP